MFLHNSGQHPFFLMWPPDRSEFSPICGFKKFRNYFLGEGDSPLVNLTYGENNLLV